MFFKDKKLKAAELRSEAWHLYQEKTPFSIRKAAKLLLKAADYGDVLAMYTLGQLFEENLDLFENAGTESIKWYTAAANQDWAWAQLKLAKLYETGGLVTQSNEESLHWLTKAADNGLLDAQYELGLRYLEGRGIEQSYDKATHWIKLTADAGYKPGIAKLEELNARPNKTKIPSIYDELFEDLNGRAMENQKDAYR